MTGDVDRLRTSGERIEALLDATSTSGPVARERAEDLVREMADLYGAGLARTLEVLHGAGRLDDAALDALAADDLVASLLLVHGLHPHDVTRRVEDALDSVRPYLGSHGGDVELLDVDDAGVVRLRLLGSCQSCPSSSVTLKLAVETAVEAAAPETTAIEVDTSPASGNGGPVISVESLRSRLVASGDGGPDDGGAAWQAVPDVGLLAAGEVGGFDVGGLAVLACRIGDDLFAFRDHCARCTTSMAGATLARRAGHAAGTAVLTCPTCHAHYDVRRAGASIDAASDSDSGSDSEHLDPLPLLVTDGVVTVAVPTAGAAR